MYYCNCKTACILGVIGIISNVIQFAIICCLLFAIWNILFKRICIEPVHHPNGEYRWAITKNGKVCRWLWKNKSKNNTNRPN